MYAITSTDRQVYFACRIVSRAVDNEIVCVATRAKMLLSVGASFNHYARKRQVSNNDIQREGCPQDADDQHKAAQGGGWQPILFGGLNLARQRRPTACSAEAKTKNLKFDMEQSGPIARPEKKTEADDKDRDQKQHREQGRAWQLSVL